MIARTTGVNHEPKAWQDARYAPRAIRYDAPWRRVLLRFLKPGQTMAQVYRAMGWSQSTAYLRRKHPHLRLQEAAQMGMALGVGNLGRWLLALAMEEGIPEVGQRLIHKPGLHARARRVWRTCTRCGRKGHRRRDCPNTETIAGVLIKGHSAANPTRQRERKAASE